MIRVDNIHFNYQRKEESVLNGLSFDIPRNSIFGFLGENGSGKTTTIRIILDLLKPKKGRVLIDGQPFSHLGFSNYRNIGALIESPSFYSHLSAIENLRVLKKYYPSVDEKRVKEVLKLVNLLGSKNKKVSRFSMGMKQRLGIAQSILHNPEILILDEPLNGLDPEGIHEMRALISDLHTEGKTILLSSHLLSELEKTCTDLCIIKKGKSLFSGKMQVLQRQLSASIEGLISCDQIERSIQILSDQFQVVFSQTNKKIKFRLKNEADMSKYIKALVTNGIKVFEAHINKASLEDLFLKINQL